MRAAIVRNDAARVRSSLRSVCDFDMRAMRSEEHTSELQSLAYLVCRLLLEKKKHTLVAGHRVVPRHAWEASGERGHLCTLRSSADHPRHRAAGCLPFELHFLVYARLTTRPT